MDHTTATLREYDTSTYRLQQTIHLPAQIPIFTSLSTARGRMFIATTTGVICLH